jgi:hypothetical protein
LNYQVLLPHLNVSKTSEKIVNAKASFELVSHILGILYSYAQLLLENVLKIISETEDHRDLDLLQQGHHYDIKENKAKDCGWLCTVLEQI